MNICEVSLPIESRTARFSSMNDKPSGSWPIYHMAPEDGVDCKLIVNSAPVWTVMDSDVFSIELRKGPETKIQAPLSTKLIPISIRNNLPSMPQR